jgi:hypothetical protein
MFGSFSIDGFLNYLRARKLKDREQILEFCDLLVQNSELLAHLWIDLCGKIKRSPPQKWPVQELGPFFETIAQDEPLQKYAYESGRALYDSITNAVGGRLDPNFVEILANRTGKVLYQRMILRGVYEVALRDAKWTTNSTDEFKSLESDLAHLLKAVAELRALVAVLHAKI